MSDPGHGVSPATEDVWSRRRTSFGGGADAYALGRPHYPAEALQWVLPAGAREVLDLGAGTGRLSERLVELGLDVVAVEPIDEMRAHVPAAARALAGTAEAIPLEDSSVDAVVVGQAFHWFEPAQALPEIARVLRPGGRLGLLWNLVDDSDPAVARWLDAFGGDERASLIRDDQPPPFTDTAGLPTPERRLVAHHERYDAERALAYVSSRSQTILLPESERGALLDRVRATVPEDGLTIRFVTEVWRSERTGR